MTSWFRFRKSIPLGKFFRINLGKSGVGASVGIPGTGVSWGISPGRARSGRVGPLPPPVSSPAPSHVLIACCRCGERHKIPLAQAIKTFPCPDCGATLGVKRPPVPGSGFRSKVLSIAISLIVIMTVLATLFGPGNRPQPTITSVSDSLGAYGSDSSPSNPRATSGYVPPGYHVGPRGGVYRYSSGGRKVYDRKK